MGQRLDRSRRLWLYGPRTAVRLGDADPMPKPPNILLLFTDQQRHDTIAACGHDHMVTPNLDRLARESCAFTQAYTPNPVCVPARHNIITGLSSRYHGLAGE